MDEIDVKQATGAGNGRRPQGSAGLEGATPGSIVVPVLRAKEASTRGGGAGSVTLEVGPILKGFGALVSSACFHLRVKNASQNFQVAVHLARSYDGEDWATHEILTPQTGSGYYITVPLTDRTKFGMLMRIELVLGDAGAVEVATLWGDLVLEFLG